MTMTLWIGLAVFFTFYFLIPALFGMRGALVSFVLPPLGFFAYGFTMLMRDPRFGMQISAVDAAGILFTGAFGGPFIFVFCVWVVAFPIAALGLWLNQGAKRFQTTEARQKI